MAGAVGMIMWFMYALGLWFGAWLISRDMINRKECNYYPLYNADGTYASLHVPEGSCITGGNIMICFFSLLFGGMQLGQAFPAVSAVNLARIELGKILDIVENDSPIDATSENGQVLSSVVGEIQLHNVSFAYPMRSEHNVYNGLDLTIEAGSTVALVGPSGCGKSTAVQLIERFYDPDAGAVLLDGVDLKTLRVSWLRQQIGLVSQEPVLFSGSISDNIKYGKEGASQADVEAAARMANAHDFICSFPDKYNTQVGEKGVQLSGGQKQRVAIARAIIRDPKILILDEATSALDTTSEKIVQEALDNLLKMKKRTTIIIAHRLSTIRDANKIVVLKDGVVVEQGTHDALVSLPDSLYNTLVKMQMSSMGAKGSSTSDLAILATDVTSSNMQVTGVLSSSERTIAMTDFGASMKTVSSSAALTELDDTASSDQILEALALAMPLSTPSHQAHTMIHADTATAEAVAVLREDDIELGVMQATAPAQPTVTNNKSTLAKNSSSNTGKKGSYAGVQVLDVDDEDRPNQCIVATEMEVDEKTSSGNNKKFNSLPSLRKKTVYASLLLCSISHHIFYSLPLLFPRSSSGMDLATGDSRTSLSLLWPLWRGTCGGCLTSVRISFGRHD